MSFILDALKKSETARQRHTGPSLFEVKVAAPKRVLPAWAVVLGALLLVNAAVLGWVLMRSPAPPVTAPGGSAAGPGVPLGRSSPLGSPQIPAGVAVNATSRSGAAPEAPVGTGRQPAGEPPNEEPPSGAPGTASGRGPAITTDNNPADFAPAIQPPAPAAPAPQDNGMGLPRYQDLAAAPGASLPPLHLDLHVYDVNPRKRYVMINMRTLRQGDSLPDGVEVVSIRPDGVVLSYQGQQFLLAR